jgi:dTDP-4-amino-4,6-dideoxygalactose transaminase
MKTIPLMIPYIPEGVCEAVQKVLQTRWIGQGPRVEEFEQKFSARVVRGRSCIAVGSCTDALHLAYLLTGIGPGDEVVAPLFTCTATNIPLLYCGAKIRFCDVAKDSLNMDSRHLIRLVNDNAKIKAIVVVHYGGAPVSNDIFEHAAMFGIPVIEDCAQALGTAGIARNDFACFSFQAVKHVTTGDGGMLMLPDGMMAQAKRRRWFGIDREAKLSGVWENDITEVGYKYQMTDIAAAMGIEGLNSLDSQLRHRRMLRSAYGYALSLVSGIRMIDMDSRSACWLCTVLVERRDDLRRKLREHGVESDMVHYRNDRYTIFKESRGVFPNMDAIDDKYLVLPLHMGMSVDDVHQICSVIRSGW